MRLLQPLATATLTELTLNGGTDGPDIAPLIEAWREAF
jgi:hypothetical protein